MTVPALGRLDACRDDAECHPVDRARYYAAMLLVGLAVVASWAVLIAAAVWIIRAIVPGLL